MRSKITLFLLFFVLAGSCFSQIGGNNQGKNSQTKALEKSVESNLDFGSYMNSLPALEQLLRQDPGNAQYNYWMGKALFHSYQKSKAIYFFEKAFSANPKVDQVLPYEYGLALHYDYRFDEAIQMYVKALNNFPATSPEYLEINRRIAQCRYGKKAMDRRNPEWDRIRVFNCGDKINTAYSEHSPVISANDSILLFTARRPDSKGAKPNIEFYDEDVYISYNRNGNWTPSQNIGFPINSTGHDATVSLSSNGQTLYLYRHQKNGNLFVTRFDTTGKKWFAPEKLGKPFNTKHYEACISMSADGNTLVFSSDCPGGLGGRDLWMVRKNQKGEGWSAPQNLGPRVNTPFDDDSPYLHPDGKTLYFSSNGPNSIGGFDIYVTEYSASEQKWLDPLNMGFPVNTPDDDIYFVLNQSGRVGYYSSGKEGGFGEKDIYSIDFPYYPYPRRNFVVQLEGIVREATTGDTLPASIRLVEKLSGKVQTMDISPAKKNLFSFLLDESKEYEIQADVEGYPTVFVSVTSPKLVDRDIRIFKELEVSKPVEVIVVPPAPVVEFMHVYFDFDKSEIRPEGKAELDRVAAFLKEHPNAKIEVAGNTDWFNTTKYNEILAKKRSQSAIDYLVAQGVDKSRLIQVVSNENRPIEDNASDVGRQYNRRVEFTILEEARVIAASQKIREGAAPVRVDVGNPQGAPGFDEPEKVVLPDSAVFEIIAAPIDTVKTQEPAAKPVKVIQSRSGFIIDKPAEKK